MFCFVGMVVSYCIVVGCRRVRFCVRFVCLDVGLCF